MSVRVPKEETIGGLVINLALGDKVFINEELILQYTAYKSGRGKVIALKFKGDEAKFRIRREHQPESKASSSGRELLRSGTRD